MQGAVLTYFESPSHPEHACEPPNHCDVPVGCAGCTPGIQHVATVAADLDGPPELEGEFLDCDRQPIDLQIAWMARDAEETHQYGDLPLTDVPVRFPPAPGRNNSIGELYSLEVRPTAFRGGMTDLKHLSNKGMVDFGGTSEDAQEVFEVREVEQRMYDRLTQP